MTASPLFSGQSAAVASRAGSHGRLASMSREGTTRVLLPVLTGFLALAAWELAVRSFKVPDAILPPPTAVLDILVRFYPLILAHAWPTMWETVLAFGLSIPLGIGLAALMTFSPVVNQSLYPNLIVFQIIPKIALAPLFIVWLGIGTESRVAFSIFISFFPILIATAAGLQAVDRDVLRLCRSLKATRWQVMTHIRFPYSLPFIFSGMKVAVTLAIIGIVVGEFIASTEGLGYLILFATSRQQPALGLAAVAVLCAVGLVLYGLVALFERWMEIWYGSR